MATSSSSYSSSSLSGVLTSSASNGANRDVSFIQHNVSKMDTVAGVAIKYGVEVADIKRMNGLSMDLQMFALKSLRVPYPGRHPLSPIVSSDSASLGDGSCNKLSASLGHSIIQSARLKSGSNDKVPPAVITLENYNSPVSRSCKATPKGTVEMTVYRTGTIRCLPTCDQMDNENTIEDVPIAEGLGVGEGDREGERSNEKSIRRRPKTEADSEPPESLLKEEKISIFVISPGKSISFRPTKTHGQTALSANFKPGGRFKNSSSPDSGESIVADKLLGAVHKSVSMSSLPEQDQKNNTLFLWKSSNWSLRKPDFQTLYNSAIGRPIFDGSPKPITGCRNKDAVD